MAITSDRGGHAVGLAPGSRDTSHAPSASTRKPRCLRRANAPEQGSTGEPEPHRNKESHARAGESFIWKNRGQLDDIHYERIEQRVPLRRYRKLQARKDSQSGTPQDQQTDAYGDVKDKGPDTEELRKAVGGKGGKWRKIVPKTTGVL
jgi:hypothetical protein